MNDFDDITSRLRRLGQEPIDPQVAARHMASFAELQVAAPPPRRRFRPALAGGILAGALLGGTGLAGATGNLGPLQEPFHRMSAAVGVSVPRDGHGEDTAATAKEHAAQAVEKADQARQQAQEATEAAQEAGETARAAQEEVGRVDAVPVPSSADVPRFYGTPEAPCTVPPPPRPANAPADPKRPPDAADQRGTNAKGPADAPGANADDAQEPPRVPFTTGNHTDYVLAHPPALREEAARSDCGKPLSEVKPPPPGPPPPASPNSSPGPKPPLTPGAPPAAKPVGPPAGNADGTAVRGGGG